jgi:hypothetical protein
MLADMAEKSITIPASRLTGDFCGQITISEK